MSEPWLHVIGIGEDGMEGLPPAARTLVENAEIILGGDRHHRLSERVTAERIAWPSPFDAMIDTIRGFRGRRAVILVTGAGGAFKQVLVDTGAGTQLANAALSFGMTPLVAGYVLAVLIRVAQGSATVAMITAAGLVAPIAAAAGLSAPELALVALAVACGAAALSHVNDSGFWLVNRIFGLTERETFRTWTVTATLVSLVGFLCTCVLMLGLQFTGR